MKISASILEEFEKFLIEEDCFSQFCTNTQEELHISFNELSSYIEEHYRPYRFWELVPLLVSIPFTWSHTNQGYDYWEKISSKWMEISKKFLNNS